jgi:hypothetical protein
MKPHGKIRVRKVEKNPNTHPAGVFLRKTFKKVINPDTIGFFSWVGYLCGSNIVKEQ